MIKISMGTSLVASRRALSDFNFQTYRNRNSPYFSLLDGYRLNEESDKSKSFFSITYHYLHNPVGFEKGEDGNGVLIPGVHNLNVAGEYAPTEKLSLGLDMPLHQLQKVGQSSTFSFGDMRIFARTPLFSSNPAGFRFSFIPSLYAPTGNKDLFLSNSNGGVGFNFVGERAWGRNFFALNLGSDHFPSAAYRGLNYSLQLYTGVGYRREFSPRWALRSEWLARRIGAFNTGDLSCVGEYKIAPTQAFTFGASLASNRFDREGFMYRLLLGFQFSPAPTKIIKQVIQKTIKTVKKTEKIYDCGPKPQNFTYTARKLRREELKFLSANHYLPYRSTNQHPFRTLSPGEFTHEDAGTKHVKDSQVVFAVDIKNLPKRGAVISIQSFEISVKAAKLWKPSREKTDMLCVLNNRTCSGDLYSQKNYLPNIDQSFFFGKEPPNDYFTREVPRPTSSKENSVNTFEIKLPFKKLMENSIHPDLNDLIYPGEKSIYQASPQTLYFAAAHDLMIRSLPKIHLRLNVESCREITPEPSVTTEEETTMPQEEPIDE